MSDPHQAAIDAASVYKANTQSQIHYAEPLDDAGLADAQAADARIAHAARVELEQLNAAELRRLNADIARCVA